MCLGRHGMENVGDFVHHTYWQFGKESLEKVCVGIISKICNTLDISNAKYISCIRQGCGTVVALHS